MAVVILKNGNPAVWVHDANLGQDGRAGHPAVGNDAVDAVTFDSGGHQNRQGLESGVFEWTGLFEGNATTVPPRSYAIAKDLFGDGTGNSTARVTSYYMTDPSVGAAPGWGFDAARGFGMAESGGPGELEELTISMQQDGTVDHIQSMGSARVTNTFTSTWLDLGASSTAGGRFYLHIGTNVAVGGNTRWNFTIQHASATNAATVVATGATATYGTGTSLGAILESTGQLRQFVRMVGTRDATSGTIEYIVGGNRI